MCWRRVTASMWLSYPLAGGVRDPPAVPNYWTARPPGLPSSRGADGGWGEMSEALVIVLIAAVVAVLVTVLVLARRRPPQGLALDEEALRRLIEQAVIRPAESTTGESAPAAEPDLGRFASLSHEAAAAADAADAVRRTASEAADELRERSRQNADQVRADARAEAERTVALARAQAAELREGLESERNRVTLEATAALSEDRKELQEAEQRLRAATQALSDEQQALVADRRRVGTEEGELIATKRALQAKAEALAVQTGELATRA